MMDRELWDRICLRLERGTADWIWCGATTKAGYGVIRYKDVLYYVHRVAYERFWGPIPKGMKVVNVCSRRNCVCPGHLKLSREGQTAEARSWKAEYRMAQEYRKEHLNE